MWVLEMTSGFCDGFKAGCKQAEDAAAQGQGGPKPPPATGSS
jgi:hypothetical protein